MMYIKFILYEMLSKRYIGFVGDKVLYSSQVFDFIYNHHIDFDCKKELKLHYKM